MHTTSGIKYIGGKYVSKELWVWLLTHGLPWTKRNYDCSKMKSGSTPPTFSEQEADQEVVQRLYNLSPLQKWPRRKNKDMSEDRDKSCGE